MRSGFYAEAPGGYLRRPRERWVDIEVQVEADAAGRVRTSSRHTSHQGEVLQSFSTVWDDPAALKTEYAWGLSLVHDTKDHIFYGLGLTPLTEIQTIVQTYYGRDVARGTTNVSPEGDSQGRIREHVFHELFGLKGRPLIYDPSAEAQQGTLARYAPDADGPAREEAYEHLVTLCEEVMLPPLQSLYSSSEPVRLLQASARDQPALVEELLAGLNWADRPNLLLRLSDNIGFHTRIRAYVDEALSELTAGISRGLAAYAETHGLVRKFGQVFDTTGYLLP